MKTVNYIKDDEVKKSRKNFLSFLGHFVSEEKGVFKPFLANQTLIKCTLVGHLFSKRQFNIDFFPFISLLSEDV